MNNSAIGDSWKDIRKELFTPEEIAESDLRTSIIGELIKTRQEKETYVGGAFVERILADLIAEGYGGNDLLERFKKVQEQVRPAVEAMLVDAERVASSESGHISYEDVFGTEEEG